MSIVREPSEALRLFRYPLTYTLNGAVVTTRTGTLKFLGSPSYYWVITGIAGTLGGRIKVQLRDSQGIVYSTAAVEGANIVGTAQYPYEFPIPLVLPPSADLFMDLTEMTGGANTGQIVLLGYRHTDLARPPKIGFVFKRVPQVGPAGETLGSTEEAVQQYRRNHPFMVVGDVLIATPLDELPVDLKNTEGAETVVRMMRAFALNVALGDFQATLGTTLSDEWDNGAVIRANGWGTAQLPYVLPAPRIMASSAIVRARVKDLSNVANQTVQLVLDGVRRYGPSR